MSINPQEMLLQMARDNTRLALNQLNSNPVQVALAITSLKNAQMNLEHLRSAECGVRNAELKAGSGSQQPITKVIDV